MSLNGTKLSELPNTNTVLPTDTVTGLRGGLNVMFPASAFKGGGGAPEDHTHVMEDITDLGGFVTIGTIEW